MLLRELRVALDHGYYDHVGSSQLWQNHVVTVERLQNVLNDVQVNEVAISYSMSPW